MKRLYNEYDRLTNDGEDLAKEMGSRIAGIVTKWKSYGFSVRDISSIMHDEVTDASLMEILTLDGYPEIVKK